MQPNPSVSRYSRQTRFEGIGHEGQRNLARAHAVILGCGALGCIQAMSLARAGVGKLTIIDRDFVDESNLQRQVLFDEDDARDTMPKAEAARRRLSRMNSEVEVHAVVADLDSENALELLQGTQLLLDGTDNFETRYLLNDFAVQHGTPWIYGAAVGSYGICMPVLPGETVCLRCVFPDPPGGAQPTCETDGVIGPIVSLIGAVQCAEALKILSGHSELVAKKLTTADVWRGGIRQIEQPDRNVDCPCCSRRNFEFLRSGRRAPISLCGRDAVQIHERRRPVNLQDLAARLAPLGQVRANDFALRFFVEPYEMTIFPDGRAIIKGTQDTGLARSLYSRYLGN